MLNNYAFLYIDENEKTIKSICCRKRSKKGLSYFEAQKYCKAASNNPYVKDWDKVGLPHDPYLSPLNRSEKVFWTSSLRGNGPVTYYTNSIFYVPENSKEVYTLCVTPASNLNNVYIYSLSTLCP